MSSHLELRWELQEQGTLALAKCVHLSLSSEVSSVNSIWHPEINSKQCQPGQSVQQILQHLYYIYSHQLHCQHPFIHPAQSGRMDAIEDIQVRLNCLN